MVLSGCLATRVLNSWEAMPWRGLNCCVLVLRNWAVNALRPAMSETPVLSCFRGREFTGHLDSEVQILATVADGQDGHVPPAALDMSVWDPTRAVFMGR